MGDPTALKNKQPGIKSITGLCGVHEVGSKGQWDVVMIVELNGNTPASVPVRSVMMAGTSGMFGEDLSYIGDREIARRERDRVLLAMNSGEVVWVFSRGLGTKPEPLYAKRDFGWSATLPKRYKVCAKRNS